jgi:arginyl-tRNA synthetase
MNLFQHFRTELVRLVDRLAEAGRLPAGLDTARLSVEPPRDAAHGDVSTNAAMVLAKPAGLAPRALAEMIAEGLRVMADVTEVTIAGPGFVNWRLGPGFWQARLRDVLLAGPAYGASRTGEGRKVNVEYVSANPTGPMHVGHARGAVFGDVLAALLEKAGFLVIREYYINDAGAQVDVLARSAYLRYLEALGEVIESIPEGLYPGDYLKGVGAALAQRDGDRWRDQPESVWLVPIRDFAIEAMMDLIREDLALLGVRHAVFSSERALQRSGAVEAALATLEAEGLLYTGILEPPKGKTPEDWEPRPQTLFQATKFGDDVDRPLKKSDGSWTYFAADIAYHYDKYRRGSAELIDVLGADHGGYVKRMTAAVTAITGGKAVLDCKICQLVHLYDHGEPVKMSKRAGTFVTLRDVVEQVGRDIVRFMMLTRRNDQTIDFDFAKVVEQSRDNMIWYVQYAHARIQSVLRHARAELDAITPADLASADLSALDDPAELTVIRLLAGWPRLIESAAEAHEPHRLAHYLYEVAGAFHALWNKGKDDATLRFIHPDQPAATRARLALVQGVAFVIASGLDVFGVEAAMELR